MYFLLYIFAFLLVNRAVNTRNNTLDVTLEILLNIILFNIVLMYGCPVCALLLCTLDIARCMILMKALLVNDTIYVHVIVRSLDTPAINQSSRHHCI